MLGVTTSVLVKKVREWIELMLGIHTPFIFMVNFVDLLRQAMSFYLLGDFPYSICAPL